MDSTFSDDSESEFSDSDYSDTNFEIPESPRPSSQSLHICTHIGCDKKFGKPSRLLIHERTHTGERPFKCDDPGCNKAYARQQHLTRHLEVFHCSNTFRTPTYTCDICSKVLSNKYSLQKHQSRQHKNKKYDCMECNKVFHKQHELKAHSYIHTGIIPFRCEHDGCELGFKSYGHLKRHMQTHILLRYKCTYDGCFEAFNTYSLYRKHISEFHPKECDICGKPFKTTSNLKKHRQTHNNVRVAYYCMIQDCGRCYYDEKNLKEHISVVHNKKNLPHCKICHKYLSNKTKLDNHMKTHSPNYQLIYKPKKLNCKSRKDKGIPKIPTSKLLSGFEVNPKSIRDKYTNNESALSDGDSLSSSCDASEVDSGMSLDGSTDKLDKTPYTPYARVKEILFDDL